MVNQSKSKTSGSWVIPYPSVPLRVKKSMDGFEKPYTYSSHIEGKLDPEEYREWHVVPSVSSNLLRCPPEPKVGDRQAKKVRSKRWPPWNEIDWCSSRRNHDRDPLEIGTKPCLGLNLVVLNEEQVTVVTAAARATRDNVTTAAPSWNQPFGWRRWI